MIYEITGKYQNGDGFHFQPKDAESAHSLYQKITQRPEVLSYTVWRDGEPGKPAIPADHPRDDEGRFLCAAGKGPEDHRLLLHAGHPLFAEVGRYPRWKHTGERLLETSEDGRHVYHCDACGMSYVKSQDGAA
jgi:hypothetical protein